MEEYLKGKWMEVKGEVRKAWGKLTDDELEMTKGDMLAVAGLIRQKYGEKESEYSQKLSDIFNRFKVEKDRAAEKLKDNLRKSS